MWEGCARSSTYTSHAYMTRANAHSTKSHCTHKIWITTDVKVAYSVHWVARKNTTYPPDCAQCGSGVVPTTPPPKLPTLRVVTSLILLHLFSNTMAPKP